MVVYHLQLTYAIRNRNSQFGGRIHLTIQNFGYCLTTVHPRCPCFYDSGKIFGRPLHTERTSVHQNKNSRFTGCSHFLYQLVLQTYEVDIRTVGIFTVRTVVPTEAHHIFACHYNIEISTLGTRSSFSHFLRIHVARIPTLVYKIKLSIGSNHFQTFQDGSYVFIFLRSTPVTQDILVVGIDTGHHDLLISGSVQREHTVILQQYNAIAGRLKSRCTMLIAKAHFHGFGLIGIRLFEKAETEFDIQYAAYRLVNTRFWDTPLPH